MRKGANTLSSQAYKCGCNQLPNAFEDWCAEHRPRGWAKKVGYRWWVPEEVSTHNQKKLKDLLELRSKSLAVVYKLEVEMWRVSRELAKT